MIKQTKSVQAKHAPLLNLFLNGYENMRQRMDAPCRRPLLDVAPLAFGKWYYAALAQETILSPANLFALDLETDADAEIEYAYAMRTTPAEEQPDAEFISEYSFSLLSYSTQEHPLVADLQALISYCTPDRATDEGGLLLEADKKEILSRLSLQSDFYLEYLMRLAWLHGLLVPMPSIHTRRVQPALECEDFFAQDTADILFQLGESACTLAAERFMESMDLESGIAPPDFFYHLLESNQEIDRIFMDFYKKVDVDIAEIWKIPPEQLNAEERSIVSSFLFTGIMLDKWFLTPMSLFFHFIRPISFTPVRFYSLVNTLASLILMEHNVSAELFTPPTYYSLTALGKQLFADETLLDVDKQRMPRTMPYEQLQAAVLQEAEAQERELLFLMEVVPDVLSVKITQGGDADLWRIIEVGQDMDLDTLCRDLCGAFCMEDLPDYLLSVPDKNGFPLEYSTLGSKRSLNKANGKALQELPLAVGSLLTLYPTHSKAAFLTLEILEKGKGNPYLMYPRVTKQSPKMVELEKMDEMF